MGMTEEFKVGNLSLNLADHVQILDGFAVKDLNRNFCSCENVFSILHFSEGS